MSTGFARLVMLALFSGLSMNLILQCGLGIAGIIKSREQKLPLISTGIGFITVLILWFIFNYLLAPLSLGLFEFILCFPAASLVYCGLEYLVFSIILKNNFTRESSLLFYDGLCGAILFIMINLASGFWEAFAVAFGFSAGIILTLAILSGIYRRSKMEAVPKFLRSSPLLVISMGLLSLVFGSAAVILFRTMGG